MLRLLMVLKIFFFNYFIKFRWIIYFFIFFYMFFHEDLVIDILFRLNIIILIFIIFFILPRNNIKYIIIINQTIYKYMPILLKIRKELFDIVFWIQLISACFAILNALWLHICFKIRKLWDYKKSPFLWLFYVLL